MSNGTEYAPPPRAADDFEHIGARLREIEREKEEARKRESSAP